MSEDVMIRSAESIGDEMCRVRKTLTDDFSEVVESAREMTDWRVYVNRYPWVCLGAAAAVGFVMVPKRTEIVSPDANTLLELAKDNKLVVKTNPDAHGRPGLSRALFSFLGSAALRAGMAYAGQQLGKLPTVDIASESEST